LTHDQVKILRRNILFPPVLESAAPSDDIKYKQIVQMGIDIKR